MEQVKRKKKGRPKTVFHKVGRKPKLNMELINELETFIEAGHSIQTCCGLLDISEAAYYKWVKRAYEIMEAQDENEKEIAINSEDEIYIELVKTVKRATARFKQSLVDKLIRHGNRNYQPIEWLLERRFPDEYGKQDNIEVGISPDNTIILKTLEALKQKEIPTDEPDSNE